jgi:hypothetical protein
MKHVITNELMERYVRRWIRDDDNCYTFEDVMECIKKGQMQSHVFGSTWVLTSIHDFPQRKTVHIDLVVGEIHDAIAAEPEVCDWARNHGASLITGSGRPGWDVFRDKVEGWRMKGYLYSKELGK